MTTMYKYLLISKGLVFIFVLFTDSVFTQQTEKSLSEVDKFSFLDINTEKLFKPIFALETWATYSIDEEKNGTSYTNRADIFFRRLRFGGTGSPYSWLSYNFQLHLDRLGEDTYASTKGSYGGIDIWNAHITAKLLKDCDLFNLHAGYFWAAISREYNTSAWSQGSLDRTRANWYMRNFITGKGNGIECGIGLGGLKNFEKFGVGYRIGTFEPQAYSNSELASRLYTGHFLFTLGDPELSSYKYRLPGNQWRKRTGITLGFGASTQSKGIVINSIKEYADSLTNEITSTTITTPFDQSYAYGTDILINYKGFRLDGEYFVFCRTGTANEKFEGYQWHIRFGCSLSLAGMFLEPVITYDCYEGKGNKDLYKYIGTDQTLDLGINWYLNKDKLKLSLHYLIQDGSVSSNVGDYLGMAFQFRI